MGREINFYRTRSGKCPMEAFFDSLQPVEAQKVAWVLRVIQELDKVPSQYFKKLIGSEEIWECRIQIQSKAYRIFSFFLEGDTLVLTHGYSKKSQKTDAKQIKRAENYRRDYLGQRKEPIVSDLEKYISKRKKKDPHFAKGFEEGYKEFKIGVLLKQAREEAGLTQEQLAGMINTQKTAISRIENHAEDIKLSTIQKVANALGKNLEIILR
ncbi:MAG: XRE family transcriptional regulator [Pseudomonadota bacterium]